jgi:hypothetical protein
MGLWEQFLPRGKYISNLCKANLKPQSKGDSQTDGASAVLRHLKPLPKATPETLFEEIVNCPY